MATAQRALDGSADHQTSFSAPSTAGPVPGPAPAAPQVAGPRSLDDLALLPPEALAALYCGSETPRIRDLDGDLVGRMLAVPGLPRWMAGALRRFAAWARFPWRGKSFKARHEDGGDGINRVFGDRQARRWFRFETYIAGSRAGSFDAFHLDYDNADNPRLIRAIKDEVRQVAPGLYLGLAYFMWRRKPRLVLYFALERKP